MPTATKAAPKAKKARKAPRRKTAASRKTASAKVAPNTRVSASVNSRDNFGSYAESAVLIPVGAALVARDRVVNTVTDTISTYSSSSKTQAQLRRFERRGVTARKRLEREVRKARVRFERQLRQRRRALQGTVNDLEGRRDQFTKNGSDLAKDLQERVLSLV